MPPKNNSSDSLENFYKQGRQYLHDRFQDHPTALKYGEVSAEEKEHQSYYDAMAGAAAEAAGN